MKISITVDNIKHEFESMEEAKETFPNIEKDMNAVFEHTDKAFKVLDEAFDMMDNVFKKVKKIMKGLKK